jgi:peptide/nickel transport system substrate-binding protein
MPIISETVMDGNVSDMMFLSLLSPRWEDGELLYQTAEESDLALARSYEYFGPDSASIRYHMRGDVRWSDGRPVTAHDAAWTLETQGDPQVASPRFDYNQQIEGIEVEDDSTLVVHFSRRYPEMLFHTAGNVAPSHIFEGSDLSQLRSHPAMNDPAGGNLPASGPYMLQEWIRGQRIVLVPNPEFQPQPNIQRVVFLPIPEQTTRMIELQTGNADMMVLPFDQLGLVREQNPEIRFEVRRRRFYDYIAYNPNAHPFLADEEIRRALGLAIDRPALIAALQIQDYAEPAGGPYSPVLRLLHDPVAHAPLPFDTAEAKRILDAKGWVPGADGIRVRNGVRFSFTLGTNAGNQRRADASQIIQQAWRRIGVDVVLQTLESNTFFDRLTQRDFESALAGWSVGLSADLSGLWTGDSPFNYTSFQNDRVDELVATALSQPTEEVAAPFWREAAAIIISEQPYSWLYYMDEVWGVNDRIRNTRIDTLGTFQNIHEWTIVSSGEEAGEAGAPS